MLKKIIVFFFISSSLIACGSNTYVKPNYIDPEFNRHSISTITVLPVVDARIDRSYEGYWVSEIRESMAASLMVDKGYAVDFEDNIGSLSAIYIEDIQTHSRDWIEKLGPESARWIFLMVVIDIKSEVGFGRAAAVELQAFLFDKQLGRLVWENHAVSDAGALGFGYLLLSEDEFVGAAIKTAVREILDGIPPK